MKDIEPQLLELIKDRGVNGKLMLNFDGLDMFGYPDKTR